MPAQTPATPPRPNDRGRDRCPRRVLFLGTHGQFNIGDELLLDTFLRELGDDNHFMVNSYAPAETAAQLARHFDVETFDTGGDRRRFLGHLLRCDVIVFGGGSIVKELGSTVGRNRYSTLLMVLATVGFARVAARRPVLMANIGVGPLPSRTGRLLARAILRSASLVSVRDDSSERLCRSLGCRGDRLRRVPDAVFVNGPERFGAATAANAANAANAEGRLRIALNLNHDVADPASWDAFVARVQEALRIVSRSRPVEVHALPMQCRFKDDHDLAVLESCLAPLTELDVVLHEPRDHDDIAAIIAGCDVIVSERLHAIVIAAIIGRPVVALPYNVKVSELVEQLALDEFALDVDAAFEPSALAAMIERAAEPSLGEGARLARRASELRAELQTYFNDVRRWLHNPRRRWPATVSPGPARPS